MGNAIKRKKLRRIEELKEKNNLIKLRNALVDLEAKKEQVVVLKEEVKEEVKEEIVEEKEEQKSPKKKKSLQEN